MYWAEGGAKFVGVFRVKKSWFFSNFRGVHRVHPPSWIHPPLCTFTCYKNNNIFVLKKNMNRILVYFLVHKSMSINFLNNYFMACDRWTTCYNNHKHMYIFFDRCECLISDVFIELFVLTKEWTSYSIFALLVFKMHFYKNF